MNQPRYPIYSAGNDFYSGQGTYPLQENRYPPQSQLTHRQQQHPSQQNPSTKQYHEPIILGHSKYGGNGNPLQSTSTPSTSHRHFPPEIHSSTPNTNVHSSFATPNPHSAFAQSPSLSIRKVGIGAVKRPSNLLSTKLPTDSMLESEFDGSSVNRQYNGASSAMDVDNGSPVQFGQRQMSSKLASSEASSKAERTIVVFGFSYDKISTILKYFDHYGNVVEHWLGPKSSNWIYITFKTVIEAKMAISKSGKIIDDIMIGVKMYDSKLDRGLGKHYATPAKNGRMGLGSYNNSEGIIGQEGDSHVVQRRPVIGGGKVSTEMSYIESFYNFLGFT